MRGSDQVPEVPEVNRLIDTTLLKPDASRDRVGRPVVAGLHGQAASSKIGDRV